MKPVLLEQVRELAALVDRVTENGSGDITLPTVTSQLAPAGVFLKDPLQLIPAWQALAGPLLWGASLQVVSYGVPEEVTQRK